MKVVFLGARRTGVLGVLRCKENRCIDVTWRTCTVLTYTQWREDACVEESNMVCLSPLYTNLHMS